MVGWTDFILTPYKGKGGKVGNSTGVGGGGGGGGHIGLWNIGM